MTSKPGKQRKCFAFPVSRGRPWTEAVAAINFVLINPHPDDLHGGRQPVGLFDKELNGGLADLSLGIVSVSDQKELVAIMLRVAAGAVLAWTEGLAHFP